MSNGTSYVCDICIHINHVSRFQCSCCGTIPAMYSVLGKPTKGGAYFSAPDRFALVEVVKAHGADRAEHHRTVRTYLRTVKADYYAS